VGSGFHEEELLPLVRIDLKPLAEFLSNEIVMHFREEATADLSEILQSAQPPSTNFSFVFNWVYLIHNKKKN
jgi:hypothetical protein